MYSLIRSFLSSCLIWKTFIRFSQTHTRLLHPPFYPIIWGIWFAFPPVLGDLVAVTMNCKRFHIEPWTFLWATVLSANRERQWTTHIKRGGHLEQWTFAHHPEHDNVFFKGGGSKLERFIAVSYARLAILSARTKSLSSCFRFLRSG